MNDPNQDELMARLSALLESDADLDADEARALCREAGLSLDDLAELREVAEAAEFAGLLEATDLSQDASDDPHASDNADAERVTQAFLAFSGSASAERVSAPPTRQRFNRWPAALIALAAAVALIVLVPMGRDSDGVPKLDGRAQLGSGAAGEDVSLKRDSGSIDIPIKLGIGDELTVTIETERASDAWWPLLERTIDQSTLTLSEGELASLTGVDNARIRWVRLSADGSRFSPAPRPLVLEKVAPR